MTISKRRFLQLSAGVASVWGVPSAFAAPDPYPNRPIRLITPNSTGSNVDYIARQLALHLTKSMGQSIFVENMPGAGGIIGTEVLIRAPADGYTISVVSKNHVILPNVNPAVRYDAVRQITPICTIVEGCGVLAARHDFPANTAGELVAYAKAHPGKINFGSPGLGTAGDLDGRLLQQVANIEVTNVTYKGTATMLSDLLGGAIDVTYVAIPGTAEMVRAGKLKALGITRTEPVAALPNVPPISDSIPGYSSHGWYALIGPANLDAAVVARLTEEVAKLQSDQAFINTVAATGQTPLVMHSADLKIFMQAESDQIARIAKAANIRVS